MSGTSGHEPALALVLPALPDSVGRARRAVQQAAASWGASDEIVAEIALAVSEAATNVVLHAYRGLEPGSLRVSADRSGADIVIAVTDDGVGMSPRLGSPGLGLGLPTIAALTSRLEVRPGPLERGTCLRMSFALSAGAAGSAAI